MAESIVGYLIFINQRIPTETFISQYFNVDQANINKVDNIHLLLTEEDSSILNEMINDFNNKICNAYCKNHNKNDDCPLDKISEEYYVVEDKDCNNIIIDIFIPSGLHCIIKLSETKYILESEEEKYSNAIVIEHQNNYVN